MEPEFEGHFQRVINLEGGFMLVRNPTEMADTYAGIYRKVYPNWEGWTYVDKGQLPPTELVRSFYYENYYKALEDITSPDIRFSIFEFAVNAGLKKAVKIAQAVVAVAADGVVGPKTIGALNKTEVNDFLKSYMIARIKHYLDITNRDPNKYAIYLRGWLNRVFKGCEL